MAKATTNTSSLKNVSKNIQKEGKDAVKEAAFSPLMEKLMRLGYAVKGFLYIAIGLIAIAGALGKSNSPADQIGAIVAFSKLPYTHLDVDHPDRAGRVLLVGSCTGRICSSA